MTSSLRVISAFGLAFGLVVGSALANDFFATPGPGQSLTSGEVQLEISTNPATGGINLWLREKSGEATGFQTRVPLVAEVLEVSGATNWLSAGYASVVRAGGELHCAGEVRTANGTVLEFADVYRAGNAAGTFRLARDVTVYQPASNDAGFMTRFSLSASQPAPQREQEVFMPGVWYEQNQHVPARALAANPADTVFLVREDRLPLPLVMMRHINDGVTIALTHCEPDGTTSAEDDRADRVVDGRIQVASLGVWSQENPAVTHPKGGTTTGLSLIATGHSGADLFLAAAPFLYYRLYVETGDAHYAAIARLLLYNTKQAMDIHGSLGYGHPGLCTEALSLAPPRGHGVNTWLPWLTWAMIDPLVNLQDGFGGMDIPAAGTTSLVELRAKDAVIATPGGWWSIPPDAGKPAP